MCQPSHGERNQTKFSPAFCFHSKADHVVVSQVGSFGRPRDDELVVSVSVLPAGLWSSEDDVIKSAKTQGSSLLLNDVTMRTFADQILTYVE